MGRGVGAPSAAFERSLDAEELVGDVGRVAAQQHEQRERCCVAEAEQLLARVAAPRVGLEPLDARQRGEAGGEGVGDGVGQAEGAQVVLRRAGDAGGGVVAHAFAALPPAGK